MECVGKTCCATTNRLRRLTENSSLRLLSGAGEGIRTPDPLITNQMLYRLSYASNSGDNCAFAQTNPFNPFRMSGTIVKATTWGSSRASHGSAKRLLLRAVHAAGRAADALRTGLRRSPPHPPASLGPPRLEMQGRPSRPASTGGLSGHCSPVSDLSQPIGRLAPRRQPRSHRLSSGRNGLSGSRELAEGKIVLPIDVRVVYALLPRRSMGGGGDSEREKSRKRRDGPGNAGHAHPQDAHHRAGPRTHHRTRNRAHFRTRA
jgi:hypothetical protein